MYFHMVRLLLPVPTVVAKIAFCSPNGMGVILARATIRNAPFVDDMTKRMLLVKELVSTNHLQWGAIRLALVGFIDIP